MTGNEYEILFFSANGGSTYNTEPYEYTNKREAIASIKAIVASEHFQQSCNVSSYYVVDANGIYVAAGYLHDKGWWTVDHDIIGTRG